MKQIMAILIVVVLFVCNAAWAATSGPSPDPTEKHTWAVTLLGDMSWLTSDDPDVEDTGSQLRIGITRRVTKNLDIYADYRHSRFVRDELSSKYNESSNSLWGGLRIGSNRDKNGWFKFSLAGFYSGVTGSSDGSVYERDVTVMGGEAGFATRYSRAINPKKAFHLFPFIHATGYVLAGKEAVEESLHGELYSDEDDSGVGETNIELRIGLFQYTSNFFFFGFGENYQSTWNDLDIITYGVGIEIGDGSWYLLGKAKWGDQSQDIESYTLNSTGPGVHFQVTFKF